MRVSIRDDTNKGVVALDRYTPTLAESGSSHYNAGMEIAYRSLPYVNKLATRAADAIDTVVIHCTELPDMATARRYAEKIHYASGTGNSGHYYIDKGGRVSQWVEPLRIAHHVAGHNARSIGVELDNRGRYPHWFRADSQVPDDPYPAVQIDALVDLLNYLTEKLPALRYIAGHEDLDRRLLPAEDRPDVLIRRKIDPGPLFPWERVMSSIRLINIGQQAGTPDKEKKHE